MTSSSAFSPLCCSEEPGTCLLDPIWTPFSSTSVELVADGSFLGVHLGVSRSQPEDMNTHLSLYFKNDLSSAFAHNESSTLPTVRKMSIIGNVTLSARCDLNGLNRPQVMTAKVSPCIPARNVGLGKDGAIRGMGLTTLCSTSMLPEDMA